MLIFRTHTSSRYSAAALLGALETDERLAELALAAPTRLSYRFIRDALQEGQVTLAYSLMSTQTEQVYSEIRSIRERFGEDIIIVGGGAHASARPEELLRRGFDYVVIGEGERTFRDLMVALMHEREDIEIPGVVTDKSVEHPRPADLPRVILDEYPPFALGLNVVGPIEVTRGCPFSCKFCCTPFLTGGKVRHRSVESVVHWLTQAVEQRGFSRTWFLSPNALSYGGQGRRPAPEKLEQLLRKTTSIEGLDEVYFGAFPSEVRPEFITRELMDMLRSYVANTTIQIGLQSGSDRVLEAANRHHTVEEGFAAVRTAFDGGFIPHVDVIFGLPEEQQEDVRSTVRLCEDLIEMGARVHGHVFMPLPGSAFEGMPPGTLDSETRRFLGEMARRKRVTGSWSNQEKLAQMLAHQDADDNL
jgi:B12-binding domain/radical SAM domain protein